MTVIALVRHGTTEWNRQRLMQGRSDIPLSPTGQEQAKSAGLFLRQRGFGRDFAIATSPLTRAKETAECIATIVGDGKLRVVDELIERDYGCAEGLPVRQVHATWPDGEFPGAENARDAAARGAAAITTLTDGAIAVAHGTLLRLAVQRICSTEVPRIPNGAVIILSMTAGEWSFELHSPAVQAQRGSVTLRRGFEPDGARTR